MYRITNTLAIGYRLKKIPSLMLRRHIFQINVRYHISHKKEFNYTTLMVRE